jgi:DNA-binding beta-propeller fold protein YncE
MKCKALRKFLIPLFTVVAVLPAYGVAPDTATNTLTGISSPFTGAIAPNGSYVYTLGYTNSTLYKVNASNATLIKTVALASSTSLRQIFFLPDGSAALYIDASNGTLVKIATSNDSVTATTSVGSNPYNFAISPDGLYAYVALQSYPSSIKRYRTSDLALDTSYTLPIGVRYVAVSPDGSQAYGVSATQAVPFNTSTGVTGTPLTLGTCSATNTVGYTVGGNFLYVICATPTSSVYKINTATNSLSGSPILLSNVSYMMAVSPDGSFIYLQSYGANAIYKLRLSDDSITATIPTGNGPYGIAISRDATFAYSFNYGSSSITRINTGAVLSQAVSSGLSLVGGGNSINYRTGGAIRLAISSPASGADGKVTFFQNNKRIAGCINLMSVSNTVDCTYKPSVRGSIVLSARITPTSNLYLPSTSSTINVNVVNRTGNR